MTAAEYFAQAMSASYRNRGEVLAARVPEMLQQLTLLFRGYYATAAGLNPSAFGKKVAQPWDAGGSRWAFPDDCDTIYLLEQGGQEVVPVPFNDREAEPSEKCVYPLGGYFYKAGLTTDPASSALLIYYAPVPPSFTATGDSPPAEWNEQYDQMVVADLALWLASKDGRPEDVATAEADAKKWAKLYTDWLQRQLTPLVQRYGMPTVVPTQTIVGRGVPSQ